MKAMRSDFVRGAVLAASLGFFAAAAQADESPKYEVVDGGIPASLTGVAGDAGKGKDTMINRKLGNCLACHAVSALADQPFHGEVGPSLDDVASRYNEAQLRLILVDSKQVFEGTIMPAFYKSEGFMRPRKEFVGKTILTAQEVEDVIAYLETLKD